MSNNDVLAHWGFSGFTATDDSALPIESEVDTMNRELHERFADALSRLQVDVMLMSDGRVIVGVCDATNEPSVTPEQACEMALADAHRKRVGQPATAERPGVNWEQYDRLTAHANNIIYDKTKNTLADWISDYGGRENEKGYVEFGSHYALAKMLDRRDKEVIRNVLAALFSEPAAPASTPEPDDLTKFLEGTDFDAAEKAASEKASELPHLPAVEDGCEGCKI